MFVLCVEFAGAVVPFKVLTKVYAKVPGTRA